MPKLRELDALGGAAGLRRVLSTLPEAAAIRALASGEYVEVNEAFERMTGYSRDEVVGRTLEQVGLWVDRHQQAQLQAEAQESGSILDREVRLRHAHGGEIIATVSAQLLESGGERYAVSFLRDVTERRRLEESLRRSEREKRELLETVRCIVWRADPVSFRFSFVSKEAERILGYPSQAWIDGPSFWMDHIHPDDRDWAVAFCQKATQERRAHEFEYRMMRADGAVVWLQDVVRVVLEGGEPSELVGVMIDVTDRKKAEQARERSEEQFRYLAEHSIDLISRHSPEGVIRYASPASVQILGYEPGEMVGRSCFEMLHPDDVEQLHQAIFDSHGTWESQFVTFRTRRRDGRYVWMESNFRSVRDAKTGAPIEMVAVSRDVTERRTIERLRQDGVAMLSHDLKTPLSVILGLTQVLRSGAVARDELQTVIDTIESSARGALGLAMNFLDAERIESDALNIRPEPVSLNAIVEHVLRDQASRARVRDIRVQSRLAANLPDLGLDEALIERAVANVIHNAFVFSPTGGAIEVETSLRDGRVRLSVRDQGPGVLPEQRRHLFQRYSPLAGLEQSTGLGLYIVRTIVEAHRGEVAAAFPPEGGSVFAMSFSP